MTWSTIFGRAIGFASNIKIYALVAAIGISAGFGSCWWLRDQMAAAAELQKMEGLAAATAAAANKVVKRADVASAASDQLGQASAARLVEYRTIYRTIEKEIPVYVTAESDSRCVVPLGFVRLHDAAARADQTPDPATAGAPNDAPSRLGLSAVLDTVVVNYGTYAAVAQQLRDLQAWEVLRQQLEDAPDP